jgi:hypothetical protein
MERSEMLKKHAILTLLSTIPQKVLSLHGTDNITEFVLHELCNRDCFDFKKAAYLVDNPDFDCLKGIAGFSADEAYSKNVIWETPELFSEHMQKASFNKKVRNILKPSMARAHKSDAETNKMIGEYLGFKKPVCCSWKIKHDNHGILIYEMPTSDTVSDDLIVNGASLLGFCPIH